MILNLKSREYMVKLELPKEPAEVCERIERLRDAAGRLEPITITDVESPVPNLKKYIQSADVENVDAIKMLNALARRINSMNDVERQTFFGALDASSINCLGDVCRIANNLSDFEFIPAASTNYALGAWVIEHNALDTEFPESVRPYLDYAAIGAEYYANHGGAYTSAGYVRCLRAASELEETKSAIFRLTFKVGQQELRIGFPASDERVEQVKNLLGIEEYTQCHVCAFEFPVSEWDALVPIESVSLDEANSFAGCLEEILADRDEMQMLCAALEVERPLTFGQALSIAENLDDYEFVPDDMEEYGKRVLERIGADEEIIDAIEGYMDFEQLGRDTMEDDGVRRTDFGLICRLSSPLTPGSRMDLSM